ncbi:MAG: ATP-binding protein [Candidatus Binatota bacterium]
MDLQNWQRKGLLAVVGFLAFLVVAGTLILSFQWINKPFPGFFLYGNLAVGPDSLPHWSGSREGLRFLDRIVAVEGEALIHPRDLYDLVRRAPPATPFHYRIERSGKQFEIEIPSMQLSFHDWLLSFGIYLLAGMGFLAIGSAPFYFRSAAPAATPLFFMVSAIFLWFTSTFDFMATQLLPKEARILAFTMTPSAGIHLGLLLTRREGGRRRQLPYLLIIYGISVLLGLFYSSAFYSNPAVWHWVLRFSYGYSCLGAVVFLGLVWAELGKPISDLERLRLRVVFFGAILGFFLPTLGTVLVSSFYWEIPYNLLLIPAVFFPLSVAYALLKYNLFDLDAVLKVGLTRGALTGALLLIYILIVFLSSPFVGIYEKDPLVPLFFAILVVIAFNPLLRWIEGVVDRYFFPKEYDPIQLQDEASLLLRSLSRPQAIAEKYLRLLTAQIGIETAAIFSRSREQGNYLTLSLEGEMEGANELARHLHSTWSRHFGTDKKGVSKDEVEADPACREGRDEFLGLFSELRSELLISMTLEERLVGFLVMGKKRSGRGYSSDDFKLLCILAGQLALSLENGILYEESEKNQENYRLLYDQSQALNKKLVEVDRLKKQFVANISHELRTPISTVLGYSEVLLDANFTGDRRAILERVVTNGQALSHLMDSLLDFSRVETGSVTASLQEVSIREVLQSLEIMTRRLIKGRPIRFRVQIEPPLEVIETDAKKLQQILMHLLTNALKFTEKGEIALEMGSRFEYGSAFVEISVSDTGIGISKSDQEIIFEEFRQRDGSSTRQYGGTGLGLGLCRKLAQSLGGRIEVASEVGQGSVFSLMLPARGPQPDVSSGIQAF